MNVNETSVTKRVYNESLHAVIVENSQTTPHGSHFDVKRPSNKTNLQQLSSIFDTLAAKLGIKPDVVSKTPPFSAQSQNKLKISNRTRAPISNRNKTTTTVRTPTIALVGTSDSTTKGYDKLIPDILRKQDAALNIVEPVTDASVETFLGEAEVEAIDPTKYEEMLSLASSPVTRYTTTTPSLVTLLPVKSNSGIRNFNPRLKVSSVTSTRQLDNLQVSKDDTKNLTPEKNPKRSMDKDMETVVKASMSFGS